MDENGKAEEIRMKYLKAFITKYSKTIEIVEIHDQEFHNSIDLRKLKNLNYFKNRHEDVREKGFLDLSQINNIDMCVLSTTKFKFEEVLQFEGSFYQIKSDDFDKENFESYLKMWKNGEVNWNMRYICVSSDKLRNDVDCRKLVENVDGFDFHGNNEDCWFRFLLNYQREHKSYCFVRHSRSAFYFHIKSDDYDEVIKNRQPLIS
ncbi:unnamed protein product [Caenorhabditis angaria]|uniref:Sdz-33 F-box domain-containing protein n=1 Tax=Caenorhabditis angaria TaxID=860376 RepID=A0A9P1MV61_9PELO|nr:unnamed protein product [Caenorhabditis angaria]